MGREKVCVGVGAARVVVTVAVSMEGVESDDLKVGLGTVVVRVVREAGGVGAVAVLVEVRVSAVGERAGSVAVLSIFFMCAGLLVDHCMVLLIPMQRYLALGRLSGGVSCCSD